MTKKYSLALIFLILLLLGCKKGNESLLVKQQGFIVFDDSEHWKFIPTKSMNLEKCVDNFRTENLSQGISFVPSSYPDISYVKRTFDTLFVENLEPGYPQFRYSLKVTPVNIEYETNERFIGGTSQLASSYSAKVKGRKVKFSYDVFPIQIKNITPLFCFGRKKVDITECECKRRKDDASDYLYKVCIYMKKKDRYSDLPCRYNIKNIEEDSLGGRPIVKVELTCCYLGDVAYFDRETNDLISVSFGAK